MDFRSVFVIVFSIFYLNLSSAQTCEESFSLKQEVKIQEVVFEPPLKKLPIKDDMSEGRKRFVKAYNRGRFVEDERYIVYSFGFYGRRHMTYRTYRIKGVKKNGDLILDGIDYQTGSIVTDILLFEGKEKERRIFDPLSFVQINERSKEMFDRIEHPSSLIELDFSSKQLEGDKVDRLISIVHQMRSSPRVNPFKTHIVGFEDYIADHIEFIKQGIVSSGKHVNSRLEVLDVFKREAERKRDNKELTYQYWLLWNMRLSILVSSQRPDRWDWKTHEGALSWEDQLFTSKDYEVNDFSQHVIKLFIAKFPYSIALPVVGPIGYNDFNKTFPQALSLIELNNGNVVQDGMVISPYFLYKHDLNHAVLTFWDRINLHEVFDKEFSERYLQIAETLPDRVREMAEIGHFVFFHETTGRLKSNSNISNFFHKEIILTEQKDLYDRLQSREDLGAILPEDVQSDREIRNYFGGVIDVFEKILSKISADAGVEQRTELNY